MRIFCGGCCSCCRKSPSIKDLLELEDDNKLFDLLKANPKLAKKALQHQELVSRLTEYPYHDFIKFTPPENNIPQTDSSRFAFLCKIHRDVAFTVLTTPTLSSQLHEEDFWVIHQHRDDTKEMIKKKKLEKSMDSRFAEYLNEKGGPIFRAV